MRYIALPFIEATLPPVLIATYFMDQPNTHQLIIGGNNELKMASHDDIAKDGSLDFKGRPAKKSTTGGIRATSFIIGFEFLERIVFHGIAANVVLYLNRVLKFSLSEAVKNTNSWAGVANIAPLIGGFLADAYLGRYLALAIFSIIYFTGTIFLTLSATIPTLKPPCIDDNNKTCTRSPTSVQVGFFFTSLYLIAMGISGTRPCLQSLGGDQFDEDDSHENKKKSSYFNWWGFGTSTGILCGVTVVVYISIALGWDIGYGVASGTSFMAIIVFFSGTTFYRRKPTSGSPFTRIAQVLIASLRKRDVEVPLDENLLYEVHTRKNTERQLEHSKQFKLLDKAATPRPTDFRSMDGSSTVANPWKLCTVTQVEEVKLLARVLPIWLVGFWYGVIISLNSTFFTMQGEAMERNIAKSQFEIPAGSFQAITHVTSSVFALLYEYLIVPSTRAYTGNEKGITILQRIGSGHFLTILILIIAALTEAKRLRLSLNNEPKMSIFWLLPQYSLLGISNVFVILGQQHFFYEQVPDGMRGLGIALSTSALGVGRFISSFLILIIEHITTLNGSKTWFGSEINSSRIDYYYWFLAVLTLLNFLIFFLIARRYQYKKPIPISQNLIHDHENNDE